VTELKEKYRGETGTTDHPDIGSEKQNPEHTFKLPQWWIPVVGGGQQYLQFQSNLLCIAISNIL